MNERTVNAVPVGSCPPLALLPGWESFEQALASALSVLKDEFLIVWTRAGNRFVQFHARPDARVFAETVCNAYLGPSEKLDAGQMADLLSVGWGDGRRRRTPLTPLLLHGDRPLRGSHARL